jgi:hypothetical protein
MRIRVRASLGGYGHSRANLINGASGVDSNQDAACLRNRWYTARTELQAVESFVARRIAVRFSTVCSTGANGVGPESCSSDWSGGVRPIRCRIA